MWTQLVKGGIQGLPSSYYMNTLVNEFKKFSTTIPWSNKKSNGSTTGSSSSSKGVTVDTIGFSPPGRSGNNILNKGPPF